MATIKNTLKSESKELSINYLPSILQPALQHEWRVYIDGIDDDDAALIATQAISCVIDYVSCTVDMVVEQNANSAQLHRIFREMALGSMKTLPKCVTLCLDIVDGNSESRHHVAFTGAHLVRHQCVFDYSVANVPTIHELKFQFDDVVASE